MTKRLLSFSAQLRISFISKFLLFSIFISANVIIANVFCTTWMNGFKNTFLLLFFSTFLFFFTHPMCNKSAYQFYLLPPRLSPSEEASWWPWFWQGSRRVAIQQSGGFFISVSLTLKGTCPLFYFQEASLMFSFTSEKKEISKFCKLIGVFFLLNLSWPGRSWAYLSFACPRFSEL